ncbi:uncharacterized protein [Prorops nasuta]|uniref:uncharacterized protein n=1 Tax=Prorops nasuta TaxID=863751 RepID=UPI0034CD7BE3
MSYSLLPTVQLYLIGASGVCVRTRALLDQGSEVTFISESLVQLLRLVRQRIHVSISGVGGMKNVISHSCVSFRLQSIDRTSFEGDFTALVLSKPAEHLPSRNLSFLDLSQFLDFQCADSIFYIPGEITMILGVDVYATVLRQGLNRIGDTNVIAQKTVLGWIFSGTVGNDKHLKSIICSRAVAHEPHEEELSVILKQFWNIEEVPESRHKLCPDDELYETLFINTHYRDSSGRYVIKLPLRSEPPLVAEQTRRLALSSYNYLLRRFEKDPVLANEYRQFMQLYESLGHMCLIPENEISKKRAWYIPHHAVIQNGLSQRKIRVVFDASRLIAGQQCLNQFLLPGKSLQNDLSLILLGWRQFRYVFTADIIKMFRQIRVDKSDQDLQRIFWSAQSDLPPREYRLTTVTYGTVSAPYLAIRTLHQLAADEGQNFPLGAYCLRHQIYVDDIFSGADDLVKALEFRDQLIGILGSAGISLDKWAANTVELLPNVTTTVSATETPKIIENNNTVKTLGVLWQPVADSFGFNVSDSLHLQTDWTKRTILSRLARFFDPLGWVAPCVVRAKILLQDLWLLKIDWDTMFPVDIQKRWNSYCSDLPRISEITVPRWLGLNGSSRCELHGFADTSMRAYAAAVYLKVVDNDGNCHISLLTAKIKVAPVKTLSIPNLELCGAVLLVKLLKHIRQLSIFGDLNVTAWLDSRDALAWIKKHPSSWKVFVANRVSYIQTELPDCNWMYVPTFDNPADLATRGMSANELKTAKLWWNGPEWLPKSKEHWPMQPSRVRPSETNIKELSPTVRDFQKIVSANRSVPRQNPIQKLHPFLDDKGVLRVGGRISHSALPFPAKHPPILSKNSSLSQMYIQYAHSLALHGGPTLTLGILLQSVWVIGAIGLVKQYVRNCIRCFRARPRQSSQQMGNLPAESVTPSNPFQTVGLDYAGPFKLRTSKGRGQRSYKGYISLFVCFATKAIHLEAVSDLTTQSFLAAFRHFCSRRGVPQKIVSDNGTNFQGADKELREMFKSSTQFYADIAKELTIQGVSWEFIPPNAPHFGGLWEAGVRSTKHHLIRIMGDYTLTYEKFATVLAEIEACLNSRPLCPLSGDVEDLNALTPAHFLLGRSSGLIPEAPCPQVPENRLSRFQLMSRIQQSYWNHWSKEYLHHLQERNKWRGPEENFAIGQLVVLRDDRYPPGKWPLGRIIQLHPGDDGLVRVVSVRTSNGIFKRPIVRLSPLPLPKSK